MSRKMIMIISSGIILGVLGAGGFVWYQKINTPPKISVVEEAAVPKIPIDYATWKDPLDVSFSYPSDAIVDKHDEDVENYMHVEITSATHAGSLVVWAKDLPKGITDLSSWVKDQTSTGSGIAVDTTLGTVEAKKILMGSQNVNVGVVYDGLLFEIDAELGTDDYWKEVLEKVMSSYVFYPIEKSSAVVTEEGEEGEEGEEILQ